MSFLLRQLAGIFPILASYFGSLRGVARGWRAGQGCAAGGGFTLAAGPRFSRADIFYTTAGSPVVVSGQREDRAACKVEADGGALAAVVRGEGVRLG